MSNPKIAIIILLTCYGVVAQNKKPKKPKSKTTQSASQQ